MTALGIAPDTRHIAIGDKSGTVWIWDVENNTEIAKLLAHQGRVSVLAFSPDGEFLATAGVDRRLALWSTEDWKASHSWKLDNAAATCIGISPNGKLVAAALQDRALLRIIEAWPDLPEAIRVGIVAMVHYSLAN